METTNKRSTDLISVLSEVGQHAAMARAVCRTVLQMLPDRADAFEGAEDVQLLVLTMLDELDLERKAVEELNDVYVAEKESDCTETV